MKTLLFAKPLAAAGAISTAAVLTVAVQMATADDNVANSDASDAKGAAPAFQAEAPRTSNAAEERMIGFQPSSPSAPADAGRTRRAGEFGFDTLPSNQIVRTPRPTQPSGTSVAANATQSFAAPTQPFESRPASRERERAILEPRLIGAVAEPAAGGPPTWNNDPSNGFDSRAVANAQSTPARDARTTRPRNAEFAAGFSDEAREQTRRRDYLQGLPSRRFADGKTRSRSEALIEAALADTIDPWEFSQTPLAAVIEFLKSKHPVTTVIDQRALDELGIALDEPVTIELKDVALESALNLLLNDLELTFIVKDEVLLITTQEQADTHFETRVYRINDARIQEVIKQTIAPESWTSSEGAGTIVPFGKGYVIRQTYAVHAEINKLLLELAQSE